MAQQKKRKKRSKKKLVPTRAVITSSCGYESGDDVFVKMHSPVGFVTRGNIFEFYPDVPEGPAFMFWDCVHGKFRTTLVENIIKNPDAKLRRKLGRKK